MPLFIDSLLIENDYYSIVASDDCRWYPIYCKPNKEKKLAEQVVHQGISCYLPTILRHRVTRGHCIESQIPMFPGYIFLHLNRMQNWRVKTSGLVLRILPVTEETEPQLVNDLNIIRTFERLSRTQPIEIRPDLVPGKRITISQGTLKGVEGVIVKRRNRTEFIAHLDFLGYSMATVPVEDIL